MNIYFVASKVVTELEFKSNSKDLKFHFTSLNFACYLLHFHCILSTASAFVHNILLLQM